MSQPTVPPRGMRDLLPAQVQTRNWLTAQIASTFASFGYQQIETPMVEELDRLVDSEGGDNTKLIYKILRRRIDWDSGVSSDTEAADLGLRYDLTVPLARYYATNRAKLLSPFKAIQIGPVFRAERPQKGRYRQFVQCDIDVIGPAGEGVEAELLVATVDALANCGIENTAVRVNHRQVLTHLLTASGFDQADHSGALVTLDKLDKIGIEKVTAELAALNESAAAACVEMLLRLQACKSASEAALLLEFNETDGLKELAALEQQLSSIRPGLSVVFDPTMVRGQGYYTGAIFELSHPDLGSALGGGGRYDNMVANLCGIAAPAVGMSIGFERLADLVDLRSAADTDEQIVVLVDSGSSYHQGLLATEELRRSGRTVRIEMASSNRRAQLQRFSEAGFTHFAVFANQSLEAIQKLSDQAPTQPTKESP